ncbi:uncharacterized protein A4U43_C10F19530 [Asparagus officinalis]|uniref:WPP domain-associated protein n=1 Tax=Asparagus officinalis TaxID=4686 RepID=A0A5P1E429_ASPOF|nr:uncharacterized protein A4U43_C10F19530 [Asparagus officinalis]
MDDFFKGLDGRLRASGMLADSVMMGIVNSAMENAYKNSCSKEGDLVRLNEKSRFCELATIQLEWCLKFLQQQEEEEEEEEETHENTSNNIHHFVESNCDRERLLSDLLVTRDRIHKLLSDLLVTRDRIHNRLEETELMIAEKDRELSERMEIESNLRLALEVKDEDITSLNAALGLEREKRKRRRKKSTEKISQVKSCVDEQLKKLKAKLEDGQRNLRGLMRRISSRSLDFDRLLMITESDLEREEGFSNSFRDANAKLMLEGVQNLNLEIELKDMAIDMGILKEKIDSSFRTVASSVSLFKTMLDEQGWLWNVERETIDIIVKGFLSEVQYLLKSDTRVVVEDVSPVLMMNTTCWAAFIDDITSLQKALERLVPNKGEMHKLGDGVNLERENNNGLLGNRDVSEGGPRKNNIDCINEGGKETTSMLEKDDHTEEFCEESPSCRSVAQKIRSHEFIIQKKSVELDILKGEKSREKGCLAFRSERSLDSVYDMLARINSSVKSIMKEKEKFIRKCDDLKWKVGRDQSILQHSLSRSLLVEEEPKIVQPMGGSPELSSSRSCCNLTHSELSEQIKQLSREKEDFDMKSVILEETYSIIFTGLVRRLHAEYADSIIDSQVRDDTYKNILKQMIKEWSNNIENFTTEIFFMEDIYRHVFNEVIKDISFDVIMSEGDSYSGSLPFHGGMFHSFHITRKADGMQESYSLLDHFKTRENLELDFDPVSLERNIYSDNEKCYVKESKEQYDAFTLESGRSRNISQEVKSSKMEVKEVISSIALTPQEVKSSKMEAKEMISSIDLTPHDENVLHDQVASITDLTRCAKYSKCLPKGHEKRKLNEFQLIMIPFTDFSKKIMDFEVLACDIIGAHMTRWIYWGMRWIYFMLLLRKYTKFWITIHQFCSIILG